MHLSIFESTKHPAKCLGNEQSIVSSCTCLSRLAVALVNYQSMFKDDSVADIDASAEEQFMHFNKTVYRTTDLLNDYTHFIEEHNDSTQLDQIRNEIMDKYNLKQCNVSNCQKLTRHFRDITSDDNGCPSNSFYMDCYDRLHHHIFHLFEMGLRAKPNNLVDQKHAETCIDAHFKQKKDEIFKQREKCQVDVERFNTQNNINKFNIQIEQPVNVGSGTFLDGLHTFLGNGNDKKEIIEITNYLTQNEYDSDALQHDLEDNNTSNSNICSNISNGATYIHLINKYMRAIKLSGNSFSAGFTFYYVDWPFYQNLIQQQITQVDSWAKYTVNNVYSVKDLIISPTFSCLKEEILSSQFIPINVWNDNILAKANEYYKTNRVKSIIVRGRDRKKHGISYNQAITLSHLVCVILYCDMTKLCSHFSGTFRKKHQFEPLKELKARHSVYYYFSKGLVEAVNDFGRYGWNERGPFFCGVSKVLNIPYFAIFLKAPCSTSKDIQIATNFAQRGGMIMSLQNDTGYAQYQSFFNCSWLSKFSAENERLFISANLTLRTASIVIIETAQNFQKFFHALHCLDLMISGQSSNESINANKTDVETLQALMDHELHLKQNLFMSETARGIDTYVLNTFSVYLIKKTEIVINMFHLYNEFDSLKHLIMKSGTYIINTKYLAIFPNLKQIVITTTKGRGLRSNPLLSDTYEFDLESFVTEITDFDSEKRVRNIKYIIKAHLDNSKTSWINASNAPVTTSIKKLLVDNEWTAMYSKEYDNAGEYYIDRLIMATGHLET